MTVLPVEPAAVDKLAGGYFNSDPVGGANPGGLADDGHVVNFPAALADVGVTAQYVGQAAQAVADISSDVADQAALAAAMLVGSDAVQALCSSSMTVTVGLTQPFAVAAGKAYMAGMPVRFAGVPPSILIMDGRIATYDRVTGQGTFTCLRGEGIGQTGAAWNVMLIGQPVTAGGYQAYLAEPGSLSQWQSAFVATPGVADVAAAKRRVVTAYESGVSAQAFAYTEGYDFANRGRYDWPKGGGAVGLTVTGPTGTGTTVTTAGETNEADTVLVDLTPTLVVRLWRNSSTGRWFARHINYASPAAPVLGTAIDSGLVANNGLRAFRLSSTVVGVLSSPDAQSAHATTLTVNGTSFTVTTSNTFTVGTDAFVSLSENDGLAVAAVPDSGNVSRGFFRAGWYATSGWGWRERYGYCAVNWPLSGGQPTISGINLLLDQSSYGTGQPTISRALFAVTSTGHVFIAQTATGGSRMGIRVMVQGAHTVSAQTIESDAVDFGADAAFFGMGACVGAASVWICYRSSGVTKYRILTVTGAEAMTIGAVITDPAVGTGQPGFQTQLVGRWDCGVGYTYAVRANATNDNNMLAVSATTGAISVASHTLAVGQVTWSPGRMVMVNNGGGGTIRFFPWVGYTAVLASGSWVAGDVGLILHTAAGTARIDSVSLGTATLSGVNGPLHTAAAPAAGAWFTSGLWWAGTAVRGWSGGRQALCTNGAGQLSARSWKALKGVTATVSGNVYLAWSFDGRRSWRVLASGASRVIASDRAADHGGPDGTWYARDGANAWTAKTSMLAALQDAMGWGVNATLPAVYASEAVMIQTGWAAGWAAVVDFALVLADASATVDNLTINYDAFELLRPVDGGAVQFRLDDPAGVQVTRVASGTSAGLRVLVQY